MKSKSIAEFDADGAISVDVTQIAPRLSLSPNDFMKALAQGMVYQIVEKGEGEDAGTWRITFRHRAKECRIFIDDQGFELL